VGFLLERDLVDGFGDEYRRYKKRVSGALAQVDGRPKLKELLGQVWRHRRDDCRVGRLSPAATGDGG